jgi:hypothetical protein
LSDPAVSVAGLWLAVVASGVYHGASPAMGWPLAVSAGLMGRGRRDLLAAFGPLGLGHLAAIGAILLPITALTFLAHWQRELRIGAALVLVGFGLYLLVRPRHPRFLARIKPTQLTLWAFAAATAHGAGLMLIPIYLGICRAQDLGAGHRAAGALMGGNLTNAVAVAGVHTIAMLLTGAAIALVVHRIGLRVLSRVWLNLERVWAASLALVGLVALTVACLDAG